MKTENKRKYLGQGIDATNREVEIYRDGNDIDSINCYNNLINQAGERDD